MVRHEDTRIASWDGAADRGLQARREREEVIKKLLTPDVDFGVVPGTKEPTLLQPGAQKIADALNLYPDFERVSAVEDWDKPLFSYTYRCRLRQRGTEIVISSGIGTCNSMEAKYRWRMASRVCPSCGKETIIKGKAEYGGGWLCYKNKGGCGAKFPDKDSAIEGQEVGRVQNDDIYSQVNTLDKMAQKRAMVAAALNLGFSEHFTQDMEDRGGADQSGPKGKTVKQWVEEAFASVTAETHLRNIVKKYAPLAREEGWYMDLEQRAHEIAKARGWSNKEPPA